MRLLALGVLLMGSLLLEAAETQPLRSSSEHGSAMQRLWRALQAPGSEDPRLLDSHLLLSDFGRPDESDSQLMLRWSRALAQAIYQQRDNRATVASLERALQREMAHAGHDHAHLAAAFLPAPSAQAILRQEAEAAFDRGAFADFLGLRLLLAEVGNHDLDADAAGARRQELAWGWIHTDPDRSWWPALPVPGSVSPLTPRQQQAWNPHQASAAAVRWQHQQHHLLAIDPLQRVLWQRSLDRRARVWSGAGASLVRQGEQLQRIDEQGRATDLVLPADIAVIGVYGGSLWLRGPKYHYRLAIEADTADYQRFRLPAETIGPPIVRGEASLWLSAHECFLVRNGTVVGRYLHELDIDQDWQLQQGSLPSLGKVVILRSGNGNMYLLHPFPDSSQAILKVGHYNRAQRFAEALVAWEALDHEQRRASSHDLAHTLFALGKDSDWEREQVWQWITDPAWRLRILWRFTQPQPVGPHHWRHASSIADGELLQDLLKQLSQETVLLPVVLSAHPLYPSSEWDVVISNHGVQQSLQAPPPDQRLVPHLPPVLGNGETIIAAPKPHSLSQELGHLQRQRDAQGNTQRLLDGQLLRLESQRESTTVALHQGSDRHSPLLWRHRWPAPGYLPGRSIDSDGTWIVVAEGQARLHFLHRLSGARVRSARVPNGLAMPSQARYLHGGDIAILHPISVNTQLTIVDSNDQARSIDLPQPARWSVAVDHRLLVALPSGDIWVYPDEISFTWPGELPSRPPQVLSQGLWADGKLWPWLR